MNAEPHISYELKIFYFPSDDLICNTYELNIEIKPKKDMTLDAECPEEVPITAESFINERKVDNVNESAFVSLSGYTVRDTVFKYSRTGPAEKHVLPFEILT